MALWFLSGCAAGLESLRSRPLVGCYAQSPPPPPFLLSRKKKDMIKLFRRPPIASKMASESDPKMISTSASKTEIGVAVLLLKEEEEGRRGKVLLGRRFTSVCDNTFGLPAGHLEFGETFEECAAREVKEETGLDVEKVEFLTVTNNFYTEQAKLPVHLVCIFMRAVLADPHQVAQNLEPKKCGGWDWYDWNSLPKPMFGPLETIIQGGFNPFPADHK